MKHKTDDLILLQSHNPLPETADSEWADSEHGRALLAEIEARLDERSHIRRRPRWRRPTATIPVVVVLSATAFLFASAVAGDKIVTVSAQEALADPTAVERQLAEEGIHARIQIVPVKDALVGKWFHLYLDPKADIDPETSALLKSYVGEIDYRYESVASRCGPTGGECERTSILEIPGSVKGPVTLVVGREASPSEEYWAQNIDWSNELAPSGALYCYALEDMRPEAARKTLESAGYDVVFHYDQKDTTSPVDSIPEDSAITTATFRDVDTVVLNYAPIKGEPDYPSAEEQRETMGTPTDQTGRPDFGGC